MKLISLLLVVLFSLSMIFAPQPVFAATCWDCDGAGTKSCGWCGGDGIKDGRMCGHCKRGKISCFKCSGTGHVEEN